MSRSVSVRDVPDEVVSELASRAAAEGRSLQEFLRAELVRLASRPAPARWAADARRGAELTGLHLSAEDILGARDADRR